VLLTGKTDYASDGTRTFAVDNGHELLGRVTGTGCVLGTCASAAAAAYPADTLVAGIGAIVLLGIAGERAAAREHVRGPGTFAVALIDELDGLRRETLEGDLRWLKEVKVRRV
jgi:thiamine-phosphate diphosphorylase/hydroxyethylthiazole kinase